MRELLTRICNGPEEDFNILKNALRDLKQKGAVDLLESKSSFINYITLLVACTCSIVALAMPLASGQST